MSETNLLTGVVTEVLDVQEGESSKGPWRRGGFVIETQGQYPKKVQFDTWKDMIDEPAIAQGATVTVAFDIESREYNGKWYTNAKAWRVETEQVPASGGSEPQEWESSGAKPLSEPDDDLPF